LYLTIRSAGHLNAEGLTIPLSVAETTEIRKPLSRPKSIVLALDLSASIKDDGKLEAVQEGATKAVRLLTSMGCSVGIVTFPHNGKQALLACEVTTNARKLIRVIKSFAADGMTPMHAAIKLSGDSLAESGVIWLFTDGLAWDPEAALREADAAKEQGHRILVTGIGTDVNKPWLKSQIASTPDEYYPAKIPDQLPSVCESVCKLLLDGSSAVVPSPDAPSVGRKAGAVPQSPASEEEEKWDDILGLDEEAA
jgi:hypothetical protein